MIYYVGVEKCSRDFSDSGVQDMALYIQKKQVAGEVSLTPGAVISG